MKGGSCFRLRRTRRGDEEPRSYSGMAGRGVSRMGERRPALPGSGADVFQFHMATAAEPQAPRRSGRDEPRDGARRRSSRPTGTIVEQAD